MESDSLQSAGVAPRVNEKSEDHTGEKARKQGIHPGFKAQGRRHQKCKIGVSLTPQKELVFSET